MSRTKSHNRKEIAWRGVADLLAAELPHLNAVLADEDDFISLLVKVQPDATFLGVLKRFGSEGAPTVCFGSGYGYAGCLVGLDASVQAGKWRLDKPWQP